MNSWDLTEFVILFAVIAVVMLFPVARILNRMGYSAWWLLVFLLPPAPIVGLWLLAYLKWPSEKSR
jgi:hypothetical protein